jgi:hypothetical protein
MGMLARRFISRRTALLAANAGIFATVAAVAVLGTSSDARPVLGTPLPRDTQQLEAETALDPSSAKVAQLATAYLDDRQPGLALSLLERHSSDGTPEVVLARGRALYANGRTEEALAVADHLSEMCDSGECPAWVAMKGLHLQAFLSEMVRAGIDDGARDPAATQAALARSHREVRLVAIR